MIQVFLQTLSISRVPVGAHSEHYPAETVVTELEESIISASYR
jgi:hypothetical protein